MKTVSVTPEKSVIFAPRFANEGGRTGDFFKELYHNSNSIMDAVMKCYESGIGLIWDSHNSFVKSLANKDEKFLIELDKFMKESMRFKSSSLLSSSNISDPLGVKSKIEDLTPSEKRFSDFVWCLSFSNPEISPFQIIDYVNYINTVSDLRMAFADSHGISIWGDENTIKFDIENVLEYSKRDLYIGDRTGVMFKIRPYVVDYGHDTLEGMNETRLNDFQFYINIDYDSVVSNILAKVKLPDAYDLLNKGEDAALTKESYIADNLDKFSKEIELIGENIILELSIMASKLIVCGVSDFYKHLNNNMQKYVNYDDSHVQRFVNLTNNVMHRDLRGISPANWKLINGRMNMNAIESVVNVLNDGTDIPFIGKSPLVAEIEDAIAYAGRTGKNVFDTIEVYIFRKAFSHYYENAISVQFQYNYDTSMSGNDIPITNVTYSREFNEVRDFSSLTSVTSGIQDYVIKDYYVNLVNKYTHVKLHPYIGKKLANGESIFYMYSKIKRLRWFTMFSATNLLASLNPRISQATSMYAGIEDAKVQKILSEAIEAYRSFFNMWMNSLAPLVNDVGVPLPDHYYPTYVCDLMEKDYKMFVFQLNYNNSFTGDRKFNINISDIAKIFNSIDEDSKYRGSATKRTVSYNADDIDGGNSVSNDVIFKSLIGRLKESMMLNVDRYFSA